MNIIKKKFTYKIKYNDVKKKKLNLKVFLLKKKFIFKLKRYISFCNNKKLKYIFFKKILENKYIYKKKLKYFFYKKKKTFF